jgi:hypothetical protein
MSRKTCEFAVKVRFGVENTVYDIKSVTNMRPNGALFVLHQPRMRQFSVTGYQLPVADFLRMAVLHRATYPFDFAQGRSLNATTVCSAAKYKTGKGPLIASIFFFHPLARLV